MPASPVAPTLSGRLPDASDGARALIRSAHGAPGRHPHPARVDAGARATCASQFVLSDAELERELLLMTDHYADELFALPADEAITVRHEVSRLVLDPGALRATTRRADGARRHGRRLHARRTRATRRQPLRRPLSDDERGALLDRYDRPHHDAPRARRSSDALRAHGRCLIVDAHSFPDWPLPYEKLIWPADDPRWKHRPAICLGSDALPHAAVAAGRGLRRVRRAVRLGRLRPAVRRDDRAPALLRARHAGAPRSWSRCAGTSTWTSRPARSCPSSTTSRRSIREAVRPWPPPATRQTGSRSSSASSLELGSSRGRPARPRRRASRRC